MIVQCGRVITSSKNNPINYNSKPKGDIINVTKAAARKSILMQITKAKVANTSH
jgi:hypothetical protein